MTREPVSRTLITLFLLIPALSIAQPLETGRRIEGIVIDAQSLRVAGAQVAISQVHGAFRGRAVTSVAVPFRFDGLAPGLYEIRVVAPGFSPKTETVDLQATGPASIEIRLEPAPITEQIVVTPSRSEQRLTDTPASVSVLRRDEIRLSPAVAADDVLRRLPAFSLFRRTSSLSSHPTSQGVSLRGIGPSGASRTLVLIDGVPFNDPFGAWVYWTRVPLLSVERIEVVEGPSSSLYGNNALGGVINIVTDANSGQDVQIKPQYGDRGARKLDALAGDRWGRIGTRLEGSFFDTEGYPIVAKSERGPIDDEARVRFRNVSGRVDYHSPTGGSSAFLRAGRFVEDRVNGKIGEVNDTGWTTASAGVRLGLVERGDIEARVFVDDQKFHSTFLAVTNAATTRNQVRLATDQTVPARAIGGMAQWSKAAGSSHAFSAGIDFRLIDGDSREDSYSALTPPAIIGAVTQAAVLTVQRVSGGTQRNFGAFAQDIVKLTPKLLVTLSARADRFRNYDAHNLETTVSTGLPTANHRPSLPERADTVISPRAAAIYHLSDRVSIRGGLGAGFRAPTLNELYRQFSVGAVLTRANDHLGPERLIGGEVGVSVRPTPDLTFRATWFDNRMKDPVSNVTIGVNLQQRQNLGKTRIRGFQTDAEYRPGPHWRLSAGYLFGRALVKEFDANPALVGNVLPQVPAHRGSVQAAYVNPRTFAVSLAAQFVGRQFDDDLNVRSVPDAALRDAGYETPGRPGLPGYVVVDLMVSRGLGARADLFLGVQNLLDRAYFVQTGPSTTGTPRSISGGVHFRLAGR